MADRSQLLGGWERFRARGVFVFSIVFWVTAAAVILVCRSALVLQPPMSGMLPTFLAFGGLLAAVLLAGIAWRQAARQRDPPCGGVGSPKSNGGGCQSGGCQSGGPVGVGEARRGEEAEASSPHLAGEAAAEEEEEEEGTATAAEAAAEEEEEEEEPEDEEEEEEEADDLPPPDVSQKWTRQRLPDGSDVLSVWHRLEFLPGQTHQTVHLPFCPAFDRPPAVEAQVIEGPDGKVKVSRVWGFGARLEVRLTAPLDEPGEVVILTVAQSPPRE